MGSANLRFAFLVVLSSSWSSVAFGQAAPTQQPAEPPPTAQPPATQPPPAPPPAQGYPAPPAPAQGQPYPPPAQGQPYPPPAQGHPYPQPAQPYPYPPPTYPAPSGSYPPPQGYPPNYAPPARPAPAPLYPDDASTQASPFFDAILLGVAADERFSDALLFGGQIGGYVGGWLRLSARLAVPTDPSDNSGYHDVSLYYSQDVDLPSIMYGASLGVVVARRTRFVFSPGITLNRTDVGDYGTLFGASMPFEWVMRGGTRFGFEVAFGRGLGGEESYECIGGGTTCTVGDVVTNDRDPGIFFMIGLNIGFGIGYPEPQAAPAK